MQASTSGKPVWPDCQAASRSAETSCSRRPSAARSMLCHSIAGSSSIFCMKWQCQWSRDCTALRLRCQALSSARSRGTVAVASVLITSSRRASVACQTRRIEIAPKARWGLSREQLDAADSGLLMPPE